MLIDQYQLSFQRYTIGTEEFLQNSIFAAKLRYLTYAQFSNTAYDGNSHFITAQKTAISFCKLRSSLSWQKHALWQEVEMFICKSVCGLK